MDSPQTVVIPLHMLAEAKTRPNERESWRMTPKRTGRVIFDAANPRFPLKPAYDLRRESILKQDLLLGNHYVQWGEAPTVLDAGSAPPLVPEALPGPARGGKPASSSTGPLIPPISAEVQDTFLPQVLLELPDSMQFPLDDPEV